MLFCVSLKICVPLQSHVKGTNKVELKTVELVTVDLMMDPAQKI